MDWRAWAELPIVSLPLFILSLIAALFPALILLRLLGGALTLPRRTVVLPGRLLLRLVLRLLGGALTLRRRRAVLPRWLRLRRVLRRLGDVLTLSRCTVVLS